MRLEIDNAEESLLKVAKSHGNSGMVSVPKSWIGREVRVVLLEKEQEEDKIQEFMIEYTGFSQHIRVDWTDGEILFLHPQTHDWVGHRNQLNGNWSFQDERTEELYNKFLDEIFSDEQLLDYIAFMDVDEVVMTRNGHKVTRTS